MTRFIYKYLSAYFAIKFGKILPQSSNNPFYYEVDNLIEDLSKVFGLTKKQLKYYIKGWARKQNRNFDFKEWWSPTPEPEEEDEDDNSGLEGLAFPMIRRVMARTVANDLVAVRPSEPLEVPRGMLFYLDYRTEIPIPNDDQPNRNHRIYNSTVLNEARQARLDAELDHPEDDSVTRALDNWRDLMLNQIHNERINELYRNQLAHIQRPV